MSSPDKEYIIRAVRLLFNRIEEGKVKFVAEKAPHAIEALKAVKFDETGNPIYDELRHNEI